ncbi:Hypothetical protein SCLAV_p0502 (plasmid) [Streptomyces clavuligerus]|uniref:Uncharacterized protein n=1 Tax=Streptomyces clavuligerus TaxID=1901 RepID=D5SJ99_STRCL|nr:Hypothetical protein SCLAV_p0502 [Streptomyces clavuligerus]
MALGSTALNAGATAPIRSVRQRAGELHHHAARRHTAPAVRDYADMLRTWRSQPQAAPLVAATPAAHLQRGENRCRPSPGPPTGRSPPPRRPTPHARGRSPPTTGARSPPWRGWPITGTGPAGPRATAPTTGCSCPARRSSPP